ncbi:hypothetical protein EYF80_032937 [Liparis tanakae]|uniref:Uncharacterized protein n=1 Tax=Liparis tanakae TaxID=230148 RepID=A0A4Z2GU23_9TELE|nr:hypothetical protein EYF80_032937 [Liparis tanakae]
MSSEGWKEHQTLQTPLLDQIVGNVLVVKTCRWNPTDRSVVVGGGRWSRSCPGGKPLQGVSLQPPWTGSVPRICRVSYAWSRCITAVPQQLPKHNNFGRQIWDLFDVLQCWVNPLPHREQQKGFSPVWTAMCRVMLPCWVNPLPQTEQLKGLSPNGVPPSVSDSEEEEEDEVPPSDSDSEEDEDSPSVSDSEKEVSMRVAV